MSSLGLISPLPTSEWWRLWTCHLVHWNARHLLLNVIAAIPPIVLMPAHRRLRLVPWALMAAPLVSMAILAGGFRGEYRGASGLIVGMWIFAGLTLLAEREFYFGLILVGFVAVKVACETAGIWPAASPEFETVFAAHWAGAGAALALFVPVGALGRACGRFFLIRPLLQERRFS